MKNFDILYNYLCLGKRGVTHDIQSSTRHLIATTTTINQDFIDN